MFRARENTTFALDDLRRRFHQSLMENAAQIRAALKAKLDDRTITQAEIATALGIQQPNVSTLFNPSPKNGKLRGIDFDEGVKLIRRFNLDQEAAKPALASKASEETLARLLHALGPSLPKSGLSETAARSLAVALQHGLELLSETGASEPTDREIAMAARAAMSRYREASRS